MSLVPLDYGSSDEDDETSQDQSKATSPVLSQSVKNPHTSSTSLAAALPPPKSNSASRSSLFASLPPPTQQSNATENVASQPSERKKVKIFVDLPIDDDVLDNVGPETEQTKPKKGSSLFAMLPAPKKVGETRPERVAESSGVTKPSVKSAPAMVPYSLSKKNVPTKKTLAITSESSAADIVAKPIPKKEEEPEVGPDSFFTLSDPSLDNYETSEGPVLQQPSSQPAISATPQYAYVSASSQYAYPSHSSVDYYTNDSNAMYAYSAGYGNESITPSSSTGAVGGLSEADLRAFGTRDRKLDENIEIKEISQSQLMGNSRQLEAARSASMTGGSSATLKGLASSRGQKRKHNIMSLAFEAKQREEALKDMAAHRIASKQSTRAKYGF
ncbi:hypothetical protein SpCBS45565_g07029 [Spizellomyces sp. 'palustris']|nr:hypothetical protein SpCBS45565_g07029 [Spizellomyces sp. 'palustris']